MNKTAVIGLAMLIAGIICSATGFFLVTQATDRYFSNSPIPPDLSDLRQDQLPGHLVEYTGQIVIGIASALFLYTLVNQWRMATRRKVPNVRVKGEVWFCPTCGNLDIKGSDYCSKCGERLPKELVFDQTSKQEGMYR